MKIYKFIAVLLIILIASGCLYGCKGNNFSVYYEISDYPHTLDPQLASSNSEILIVRNTFEGLMRKNPDGSLAKGVCSDYTVSDSGLEYIFNIKDTAKWHDGSDLNANDFAFALKRAIDPATRAPNALALKSIYKAVEIINGSSPISALGVIPISEKTLKIILNAPDRTFLETLTLAVAMPCNKEFFDESKGKYGLSRSKILCNGSFNLSKWTIDKKSNIGLSASSVYTGDFKANASSVILATPDDKESTLDRLKSGAIDAGVINFSDYKNAFNSGLNIVQFENTLYTIIINRTLPIAQKELADSLTMSINKEDYYENLPSYFLKENGILPPSATVYGKSIRENIPPPSLKIHYDFTAARKQFLNAVAKLPKKTFPDVTIVYDGNNDVKRVLTDIVGYWQQNLGAYINIEKKTNKIALVNSVKSGDYSMALVPITSNDETAAGFLSQFHSTSPNNFIQYSNPNLDEIINEIYANRGSDSEAQLIKQAEEILYNDSTIIPLFFAGTTFCNVNSLTDFSYSQNGSVDFSSVKPVQ